MIRSIPALSLVLASIAATVQAAAQDEPGIVSANVARTAEAAAGEVGRRQNRDTLSTKVTGTPLSRIDSRIANRVQSRIRNRIDGNYDPRANATSPFTVAGEQVRTTGQRRR